ncbi:hypothetical protein I317_03028 [Kwoniella heveanensis CBS 569]|nr:hypothetical protein I317_03028 [Kwoniella heveanensis CBS 569]
MGSPGTSPSKQADVWTTGGILEGRTGVPSEHGYEHHVSSPKQSRDVIEAEPGIIETTDLAPLNHEKMAEDHLSMDKNTRASKEAQTARGGRDTPTEQQMFMNTE